MRVALRQIGPNNKEVLRGYEVVGDLLGSVELGQPVCICNRGRLVVTSDVDEGYMYEHGNYLQLKLRSGLFVRLEKLKEVW